MLSFMRRYGIDDSTGSVNLDDIHDWVLSIRPYILDVDEYQYKVDKYNQMMKYPIDNHHPCPGRPPSDPSKVSKVLDIMGSMVGELESTALYVDQVKITSIESMQTNLGRSIIAT